MTAPTHTASVLEEIRKERGAVDDERPWQVFVGSDTPPENRSRLVYIAALIVAEIERIDRMGEKV
jgi:hypothetical protein